MSLASVEFIVGNDMNCFAPILDVKSLNKICIPINHENLFGTHPSSNIFFSKIKNCMNIKHIIFAIDFSHQPYNGFLSTLLSNNIVCVDIVCAKMHSNKDFIDMLYTISQYPNIKSFRFVNAKLHQIFHAKYQNNLMHNNDTILGEIYDQKISHSEYINGYMDKLIYINQISCLSSSSFYDSLHTPDLNNNNNIIRFVDSGICDCHKSMSVYDYRNND